jgi:hypothetical protein
MSHCSFFKSVFLVRFTKIIFLVSEVTDTDISKAIMACLNVLKQEIKAIEASFPKTHSR